MKTRQIRNQKSLLVIGACALVLSGLLGAGASKITGNPFAGVGVATLGVVLSVLLLRREHGRAKLQNRLDQRTKKILGLLQEKKRPLAPVAPQAKARVTEVSEPRSWHGTVRPLNIDTRRLEEERCWAEARAVVPFGPTIDRIKNYYTPTQRETSSVRVAAVCDEFTYNSISPDCDLETVRPNDWREVFERHKPEVFFCESAWVGMPSSQHPWRGKIYASYLFDKENRSELIQILEHCKRRGIPTVFWNKRTPPTSVIGRTTSFEPLRCSITLGPPRSNASRTTSARCAGNPSGSCRSQSRPLRSLRTQPWNAQTGQYSRGVGM